MDFYSPFNGTHTDDIHDVLTVQTTSNLGVMIFVLATLIATLYTAMTSLYPAFDFQEPPAIPQKIPYVGHVLGLARSGITYYLELRSVFVFYNLSL